MGESQLDSSLHVVTVRQREKWLSHGFPTKDGSVGTVSHEELTIFILQ
jgi:hypothetical protein